MHKKLFNYKEFLREKLETEKETPIDKFSGVKKYIIELIIKENNIKDVKKELVEFLSQLEDEGSDNINIAGLTEDSDYYELYLEYRVEIDEKLNELDYFEEKPSDSSIFSLYDIIISGVKTAIIGLIQDIKNQLQA